MPILLLDKSECALVNILQLMQMHVFKISYDWISECRIL